MRNQSMFMAPITVLIFCLFFSINAPRATNDNQNNQLFSNISYSKSNYVPNVLVVKFAQDLFLRKKLAKTGFSEIDGLLQKYDGSSLERFVQSDKDIKRSKYLKNVYFIRYSKNEDPVLVAREFSKVANIIYAEPVRKHRLSEVPNDPLYDNQNSYYKVINASEAWDVQKAEGGDVVVAIVDGGTDIDHEDLAANLWFNPGEIPDNGVDDDQNGFIDDVHGWNFANDSNDPTGLENTPDNADHGTIVAGIVSAVSNNAVGVAGTSWNAKLMAINAGDPDEDGFVLSLYGYSGIQYAAFNGADIINCSWGGLAPYLQWEQDVINEAAAQGAVVVCAAGNDGSKELHYPSAYENAFSVAATTNSGGKAWFSNYGITIDIAAPGLQIFSTYHEGNYGYADGTSMSSPMVAGVMAMVKTQNPSWHNVQVAEQVRVASSEHLSIYYAMGKGILNAYLALTETWPSIRISDVTFYDSGGDGFINAGETVQVYLKLYNYLAPASNIDLEITTDESYITLQTDKLTLGSIGTMQEVALASAFSFQVAADAPRGFNVTFTLNIQSGGYEDLDYFILPIQPSFGTININNVAVTVTNIGRIGYADLDDHTDGIGFRYQNGTDLLWEGALILGTSQDQLSSASRGDTSVTGDVLADQDFTVAPDGDLRIITPGGVSAQESRGIFEDTDAVHPMNIKITQETHALTDPGNDDFVIFNYKVRNMGVSTLSKFYFGLFFDWDIPSVIYNRAEYEESSRMGYVYDTSQVVPTYVGVSALSEGTVSYRAIFNDHNNPLNPGWGVYDGFTDAQKWESISGGTDHGYLTAGPDDVSFVIALGPFTIEPQKREAIGFAMAAGADLASLREHVDAAQSFWDDVVVLNIEESVQELQPVKFALAQNYPNPFNPTTKITFNVEKAGRVKIDIFNTLGQRIHTLFDKTQTPGRYEIEWNGINDLGHRVASGVYIYRMTAGSFVQTRKMLLLR